MSTSTRLISVQQHDEYDHLRQQPLLLSDVSPSPSSDGISRDRHPGSHASLSSATLTLAIAAAGAGMLSFGYATRVQGVLSAVFTTIIFAALNAYTLTILTRMTCRFAPQIEGQGSYEEIVRLCLGQKHFLFALFNIWVGSIGSLTGFLIIIGALGHQAMWEACTRYDEDASTGEEILINHCGFWSSRTAVVVLLSLFVIFPLTFLRKLHHMRVSTWICFATVVSVMVVVVIRGVQAVASPEYLTTDAGSYVDSSNGLFFNPHFSFLLGAPIAIFSLGCHLQLPLVCLELYPSARDKLISTVIPSTNVLTCLLYVTTGVFGFVTYGDATDGNVLLNYPTDDIAASIAKALMALHIALAFPVCLHPAREAMDYTLRYLWRIEPSTRNTVLQSIGCLSLATLFAILIPQVQIVFGLLGATVGVSFAYFFPGRMMIEQGRSEWDRKVGYALLVWSAVTFGLGTGATIYSQFF